MENPLVAAGIALVFLGIGSFFGQSASSSRDSC